MTTTTSSLVSIILPSFQSEDTISLCLDSVLNQTYENIELVVVNDGSLDSSKSIINNYVQTDSRIRLISQTNKGLSSALNTAISAAKGEYIMFMNSDDFLPRRAVEFLYTKLISKDYDIVGGSHYLVSNHPVSLDDISSLARNYVAVKDESILTPYNIQKYFLGSGKGNSFLWGKIFKKNLFNAIVFPEGKLYEDISVIYYLADNAKSMALIDKPTYFYYQNPASITRSYSFKRQLDGLEFRIMNAKMCKNEYPDLYPLAADCVLDFAFYLLGKAHAGKVPKDSVMWRDIISAVEKYAPDAAYERFLYKLGTFLTLHCPELAAFSFASFSKIKNRVN